MNEEELLKLAFVKKEHEGIYGIYPRRAVLNKVLLELQKNYKLYKISDDYIKKESMFYMVKIINYLQEEMNKDKERTVRYFTFDELNSVANVLKNKENPNDKFYDYLIQEMDIAKSKLNDKLSQMRYLALKEVYHKSKILIG